MDDKCKFCDKQIANKGSLKAHEMCCSLNPNRKSHPRSNLAGWPKGKPTWNKGLTKETDSRVANNAKSISKSFKEKGHPGLGRKMSEETRKKHVERMNSQYASGWEPVCGRCKKYTYLSEIAGEVKLDGTWEVIAAKYFDLNKYNWKRNKERFSYTNLKGSISTYQPDFFVQELGGYVEVKGYETDLDRCKWSQFPYKLTIIRREDIQKMESELARARTTC